MASVDRDAFMLRLERLYGSWECEEDDEEKALWNGADAIAVVVGKDEVVYSKSTALQTWLFGYELADTLAVFCADQAHVMASRKKLDFLRPLEPLLAKRSDLPDLKLYLRVKGESDADNFDKLAEAIKSSKKGRTVGVFSKDAFQGPFVEEWREALDQAKLKQVDVSAAFAYASAPKDATEVGMIKKACQVTCSVFSKFLKKEIVTIVDEEKRVKQSKLAETIEQAVTDKKYLPAGVEAEQLEVCYAPIIQSGGKYQLKFSTVSSDERLRFDTIICCLGVRYKSYCSNIVRTMFVEPSQEMQDNYSFLVSVYEMILDKLRHGVKLSDVFEAALTLIEAEKPTLKDHFTRNIGFATGIEFREGSLLISPKCTMLAKKGMVFNINLGFAGLSSEAAGGGQSQTYAVFIGDTVLVEEDTAAVELSSSSKKKISSIAIFLGNEEEEDNGPEINEAVLQGGRSTRSAILDSRTRTEVPPANKRKGHQAALSKEINDKARKRLLEGKEEAMAKRPKLSSHMAYKHASVLPRDSEIHHYRIFVDRRYEAIVVPIHGVPTPFHISTVKNISKSEEGNYVYLRINFFHPGSSLGHVDGVIFPNPDATFLKEVSFRAGSKHGGGAASLVSVFHTIKDVQKSFKTREQEKRELQDYVQQDALRLNTSKGNPRLRDLYMRPVLGSRRVQGSLEAHINGLRYTTLKGDKVDLLYNNVKHAFFQPGKGEMIVLLHFHLIHPIIIGKKKHRDLQFYTEVGEIMTDLGRMQHMHDRDDLLAEQAERDLRSKLDGAFDSFRKKIESLPQCKFIFEKPFRDLGYHGVPHRSTVLLQPTTNCLVNLSDQPSFIVTLDEVELVHFERVQFHMRNFDMVFVFKDYKKKVAMITAIPMTSLDAIKEWLNSCDIKYTEGVQSLNWAKIMKTINDDTIGFLDSGGWSFLDPDSDAEGKEDDSDSELSAEYAPSSADEDFSGASDSDEDYTSISEGSIEEDEDDSDAESGKDWDELEVEAREADHERDIAPLEEEMIKRKRPVHKHARGSHASPSKRPQGRGHGSPSKRPHPQGRGHGSHSNHGPSPKKKHLQKRAR